MRLQHLDVVANPRNIVNRLKRLEAQKASRITTRSVLPAQPVQGQTFIGKNVSAAAERALALYDDGTPMKVVPRPNILKNGSFEYFQNGQTTQTPFAWTTPFITVEPVGADTIDGEYVLSCNNAVQNLVQTQDQLVEHPAGSWCFSGYVYAVSTTGTVTFACTSGGAYQNGVQVRLDEVEAHNTSEIPFDGKWYRFYIQMVTTEPGLVTLTVSSTQNTYLDALKLEFEPNETGFIEPTAYVPDGFTSSLIIRELRADNIVAGTLTVGGSDSNAPVIYVYDSTDTLIVTIGEPNGGYRGINVLAGAGIKVLNPGTIEAGEVTLRSTGIQIESGTSLDNQRSYKFIGDDNKTTGGLYGIYKDDGDSTGKLRHLQLIASGITNENVNNDSSTLELIAKTLGGDGESNVALLAQSETSAVTGSVQVKATAATSQIDINADTIRFNGFAMTFNGGGVVTRGAGTLTVSSSNDATISDHTHAITSSSDPGAAAALLATNSSGSLKLAEAILTTLKINASTLVVRNNVTPRTVTFPDVDGTIALGAGSSSVSSTNSVSGANHTHAITSSSNPGAAASILATDANGNLTITGKLTAGTKASDFGGPSNPTGPNAGDVWFRTDLGWWIEYDGTQWITIQEYDVEFNLAFTSANTTLGAIPVRSDFQPLITRYEPRTNVAAPNDASNYWNITVAGASADRVTTDTIHTHSTQSDTAATWIANDATSTMNTDSTPDQHYWLIVSAAKNNSPGGLNYGAVLWYRLIVP